LIVGSFRFPSADLELVPPSETAAFWKQGSLNLMMGKCITYHSSEVAAFSMAASVYHMIR